MNSDLNNDLKVKLVPRDEQTHCGFINSLNNRSLGLIQKVNPVPRSNIQAVAEDELVRKTNYRELRCEMPGTPRSTFLMVFSPDGTKVASTHGNHQIYISDVRTGKHIKTLVGHPRTPWCIAFHPNSNQIVASGCLGGQVRIWDLTGGSEMWTAENQSVIASIAFHPDDRLLVIATCNKLFFWDWSNPEPFMNVPTATNKEKVRYVAFDKLGQKLITGITNNPQTRWERVRSAVPVPRPAERSANYYRRRITSRILTSSPVTVPTTTQSTTVRVSSTREPLSSIPERERRITTCYRDLVRQYEALVHRYLQIYRRPVMIDQGTDPMEQDANAQRATANRTRDVQSTTEPSTSGVRRTSDSSPSQPTTSQTVNTETTETPGPSTSTSNVDDNQDSDAPASNADAPYFSESSSSDDEFEFDKFYKRRRVEARRQRERTMSKISTTMKKNYVKTGSFHSTSTPSKEEPSTTKDAPSTSAGGSGGSNTTNAAAEPLLKMKIKITPNNPEQNQQANSEPTPGTSSSQSNTNIKDLIRNAEIMLARFRENLEQRVQLHIDLPIPSQAATSTADRPSRGTNTQCEPSRASAAPKRPISGILRRGRRRPASPPGLWTRSSESSASTSDDELRPKQARLEDPNAERISQLQNWLCEAARTSNFNEPTPTTETGNQPSTSGASSINIRIDLSAVRNDNDNGAATNNVSKRTQGNQTSEATQSSSASRSETSLKEAIPGTSDENTNAIESVPLATSQSQTARLEIETNSAENQCESCGGQMDEPTGGVTPARPATPYSSNSPTVSGNNVSINISSTNPASGETTQSDSRPSSSNTTPECPRRRFLSHRLSAFHPLRLSTQPGLRLPSIWRSVHSRVPGRWVNLSPEDSANTSTSQNYNEDEVVNYAERVGEEEPARTYHPFDPPPELASINPENIGIGNMYSNIVQELESSLNDVRNIQTNRRLGETSDMLSSFSERLESIMTQSNAILRNLSTSLNSLPGNTGNNANVPSNQSGISPSDSGGNNVSTDSEVDRNNLPNNPITSDHTYPLNPEMLQTTNMSPLMISLHLTVTHIQRQARLLRQQVESIERIDRAMLEVAQLQSMRQMFDDLHRYFATDAFGENGGNSGSEVSSVRQMMAGTRISDTYPNPSPPDTEEPTEYNEPPNREVPAAEPQPSTSGGGVSSNTPSSSESAASGNNRSNNRTRRNYPRCLFLMHRQYRRLNRNKERARNIYRRFVPTRPGTRPTIDISTSRGRGYFNFYSPDTLVTITRRLEHYLIEHCRFIGRPNIPPTAGSSTRSEMGEHVMTLRLSNCRHRVNRVLGRDVHANRHEMTSVTADGAVRFAARQALSFTLDTLTRYMDFNPAAQHFVPASRSLIEEVIDLARLLSELLLLQIVDSIPPPTGMNLDPERENLSMRIDQMCSRMLDNPLIGQSNQLTRSLRLMRLTVRHATQALGQTYTARRNAMLPAALNNDGNEGSVDSRMQILDHLHNTLRNIRRHREQNSDLMRNNNIPVHNGWFRTLSSFLNLHSRPESDVPTSNSNLNDETGESNRAPTVEDANSSGDENVAVPDPLDAILRSPVYAYRERREEPGTSNTPEGSLNVPTVQINDLPVSDSQQIPQWRRGYRQYMEFHRPPFRPQFLHPLQYVNPFEEILDDGQREQIYDTDIIATVTPNHRIQVWKFSRGIIPNISNANRNVVVNECKIHNDASVDLASDGSILVTLLPSGGYVHTNRLGVYSLEWATLGQCLYVTSFEQNAVSVSLSPANRHLIVGLATRRVSIIPNDKWTMARIFVLDDKDTNYGRRLVAIRELEQNRDTSYMSVNCIRWLPTSGQGLVFATNTGQLRLLT